MRPFQLDSRPPTLALKEFAYNETRYTMLAKSNPDAARKLLEAAQEDVTTRWKLYDYWAHMPAGQALSPANVNGGEKK